MTTKPTDAERAKAYRDRKRGGPPRELKPCGTVAAYRRHERRGEAIDADCRSAWAEYQRELYARRRARAGAK